MRAFADGLTEAACGGLLADTAEGPADRPLSLSCRLKPLVARREPAKPRTPANISAQNANPLHVPIVTILSMFALLCALYRDPQTFEI